MKYEEFTKLNLKLGDLVSAEIIGKYRNEVESRLKFSGFRNGKITLLTENWANDFYCIPLNKLVYLKRYNP